MEAQEALAQTAVRIVDTGGVGRQDHRNAGDNTALVFVLELWTPAVLEWTAPAGNKSEG